MYVYITVLFFETVSTAKFCISDSKNRNLLSKLQRGQKTVKLSRLWLWFKIHGYIKTWGQHHCQKTSGYAASEAEKAVKAFKLLPRVSRSQTFEKVCQLGVLNSCKRHFFTPFPKNYNFTTTVPYWHQNNTKIANRQKRGMFRPTNPKFTTQTIF